MSVARTAAAKRCANILPRPARGSRFELIGLGLIVLATFIAYLPAMHGGMLIDDDANITRPNLQSAHGLYRIWFDPIATAQYYPVVHTAFWLEHKLWGDATVGYHVITVVWHTIAVTLLYCIVRKLNIPGALLAAALFALHPVIVESVAYIAEQKNTLSTIFYLTTILFYLQFDASRQHSQYALAIAFFALALLTKSVTVTLPIAMLVIFWWQRVTVVWNRDVRPLLPFFALSVASGLMTIWVERTYFTTDEPDFTLTFPQRVIVAGRALWFYLGKLLWPVDLSFVYPRWNVDPYQAWQWVFPIAAVVVSFLLWRIRGYFRGPPAAWLFYCGTLFPALGLINVFMFTITFVADHIQYQASIGMFVLFSGVVGWAIAHSSFGTRLAGATACVLLIATLALLTFQQTLLYGNVINLYRDVLARNPTCWLAHNNLGIALMQHGEPQGAMEHLRDSLQIKETNYKAHSNLALVLNRLGKKEEAIDHLRRALEIKKDYFIGHANLAAIFSSLDRNKEAIAHLEIAVGLDPDNALAQKDLADLYHQTGNSERAIAHYEAALRLRPNFLEADEALAHAYASANYPEKAIAAADKTIALARASGAAVVAEKIEDWLTHYRIELERSRRTPFIDPITDAVNSKSPQIHDQRHSDNAQL